MASAKKRVEMAKQQKMQGSVQINTNVDDAQKSIDELISVGVRDHANRNKHFERNKNKGYPISYFNYPKNTCKSRGSSVGHSREGSSDDGFGSSGRQTLSPSSISSSNIGPQNFAQYGTGPPMNVVHQRQASAPELINYGAEHNHMPGTGNGAHHPLHHHHIPSHHHNRFENLHRAHPGSAGLPPVAHSYSSKSLSTVASTAHTPNQYGLAPHHDSPTHQPAIHHQRSAKSCDFDAVTNNMMAAKSEQAAFQQVNNTLGGSMHQVNAYSSPQQASNLYWTDPRAKSQSLDPLAISLTPQTSAVSPLHSHQGMLTQQQAHSLSAIPTTHDDGLGPLPSGWVKAHTETGAVYFIDHNNKTTTWFDPRISNEAQAEQVRMRHSFGRMKANSGGTLSYAGTNNSYDQIQMPIMHNTPQYGMQGQQEIDRLQQLKIERNYMQERQQQLQQQGVMDQQQQSPHQIQQSTGQQQFGSPPCVPQGSPFDPQPSHLNQGYNMQNPINMSMYNQDYVQTRTSSNDSALDNTMEIDFQNGIPDTLHHSIDPALVQVPSAYCLLTRFTGV